MGNNINGYRFVTAAAYPYLNANDWRPVAYGRQIIMLSDSTKTWRNLNLEEAQAYAVAYA